MAVRIRSNTVSRMHASDTSDVWLSLEQAHLVLDMKKFIS